MLHYKYLLPAIAILGIVFFFPIRAHAATDINASTSQHFAWNDEIGWIDFYAPNTVNVLPWGLEGYASSSAGPISFNCDATNPSGNNLCARSNYMVSNDGNGNLAGWAWNDTYGWISFCGNSSGGSSALSGGTWTCPATPTYQVTINPSNGTFSGWAWNDTIGWIDFNCANTADNICGRSNFDVDSSWVETSTIGMLDSETFDTGVASGSQIDSVIWEGNQPPGTSVSFQFAVSNSTSGPWNFTGPDGTSATTYTGLSGVPITLTDYPLLNGRYFRYQVILTTNAAGTFSPEVSDIIINWSP